MEAIGSSGFSDEETNGYVIEAMMYLTRERQRAQNPSLAGQSLPSSKTEELEQQIKVGYFYELDHSKLSQKFPEQLYSIRIVMVNDKTSQSVSLRFPSVHSLRTHFSEDCYPESDVKKLPALDEKYVMASDIAAKVLYRQIPSQEMDERGKFWSFWSPPSQSSEANESSDVVSKKGSCWSELRFNGLVQWGKRRQVRFLNRHEVYNSDALEDTSTAPVDDEENIEEDDDGDSDEEEDECDDDKEEEEKVQDDIEYVKEKEEDEIVKEVMTRHSHSRKKRKTPRKNASKAQISKKAKRQKQNQTVNTQSNKKKLPRNSIDRWSAARYKLAEENMLKIMKAKGAFSGNPILRPALRAEARKLIGDTGLLDHLLKHMAGKLAPGGADRFRRRHNSDGAMEYWIESADLENIRRQAGVQDPYWTPPPGWKPGDNPLQDPISAREIETLKKEVSRLKRNNQELAYKREDEAAFSARELKRVKEEIAKMKRDMEELSFKKPRHDLAMAIHPNTMLTTVQCDNDNGSSVIQLKKMYMEMMHRKSKIEEQFMEFSEYLSSMEEYSRLLKSGVTSEVEQPHVASLIGLSQNSEITREMRKNKGQQKTKPSTTKSANRVSEDKATKIQRLRSGFRICKPQGSFVWPNTVAFSDPLVVPTPPSVSSTSAPHGSHVIRHAPPSPVKPLAEKRPIKPTTLLTVSKETCSSSIPPPPTTPSSRTINIFNLNEAPSDQITTVVAAISSAGKEKESVGKDNLVKSYCEHENQKLKQHCGTNLGEN